MRHQAGVLLSLTFGRWADRFRSVHFEDGDWGDNGGVATRGIGVEHNSETRRKCGFILICVDGWRWWCVYETRLVVVLTSVTVILQDCRIGQLQNL